MKKLLFITILALLMLSGCVKTVTLVVYNNSGKDVCITALGGKHDLKRQTAIRILAAAESKHSLQVTDSAGNSYTASFTTPLNGEVPSRGHPSVRQPPQEATRQLGNNSQTHSLALQR